MYVSSFELECGGRLIDVTLRRLGSIIWANHTNFAVV